MHSLPTAPGPTRILVVDDDLGWTDVLSIALAAYGSFAVESFCRPRDALDRLAREPRPRVAVVDYAMPEIDGRAFCEAASRIDPRIALVLVTAVLKVDASTRERCTAVLRKPVAIDALVTAVRNAADLP
jgi:DNA-binding NtrC family response regulator